MGLGLLWTAFLTQSTDPLRMCKCIRQINSAHTNGIVSNGMVSNRRNKGLASLWLETNQPPKRLVNKDLSTCHVFIRNGQMPSLPVQPMLGQPGLQRQPFFGHPLLQPLQKPTKMPSRTKNGQPSKKLDTNFGRPDGKTWWGRGH